MHQEVTETITMNLYQDSHICASLTGEAQLLIASNYRAFSSNGISDDALSRQFSRRNWEISAS